MKGLKDRVVALEGGSCAFWCHEDWMDYFARQDRGEDVDHLTPRPAPGLLALLNREAGHGSR